MGLFFRENKGSFWADLLGDIAGTGVALAAGEELNDPETLAAGALGGEAAMRATDNEQDPEEQILYQVNGTQTILTSNNELTVDGEKTDYSVEFDEVKDYIEELGADKSPVYNENEDEFIYAGSLDELNQEDLTETDNSEAYNNAVDLLDPENN
jgi:hypothetical protein